VTRVDGLAQPVSREGPDFVVKGVTLTQFDARGHATNKLFAEALAHFASDDRAELTQPRLVSLQPGQPQLESRAQRALVEASGERILLSGDVVITRAAAEGSPPMRFATQKLQVLPDVERYSTDAPVEIEQGESVVRSIGMDYDNIARVVKFRSQVRGTMAGSPRAR
jgi:lipopolysaccharide export system protein LptC